MPSTPHRVGYAELLGRLRHVLTINGDDTVTTRPLQPYFDRYGWPQRLHAHVLFGLDSHLAPDSLLNFEPAPEVYGALGYPLTVKATILAAETERLAEQGWTWGHALDAAVLRTRDDDEPDDTRLGDAAVMAVLSHLVARHSADMTSPAPVTVLFHRGYPTGLLGLLAAYLRIDAVHATALGDTTVLALFSSLGWTVSPRAAAVLTTAEQLDAAGGSGPTSSSRPGTLPGITCAANPGTAERFPASAARDLRRARRRGLCAAARRNRAGSAGRILEYLREDRRAGMREYIARAGADDAWLCRCGNSPETGGFVPVRRSWEIPAGSARWRGRYCCLSCGLVVLWPTREIVGQLNLADLTLRTSMSASNPRRRHFHGRRKGSSHEQRVRRPGYR
ncbi:hypothetical protein FAIPA1_140006 [Frankia sp. AiPs1]|uniref:hypothetical protein n=1 Tax=Frankia sp. AiPa1 TaxID=573492 RepID=UPI00202ACC00|nr:hypothetical protein [Frankia sp. AiPa1]MCL9758636.1 hypothetical protein [Frankia sp. AiPa1]